jgi:positive regulator of sigma E activity
MKQREPDNETDILRCPDALDCAECAAAVECLSDILSALSPEQKSKLYDALRGGSS